LAGFFGNSVGVFLKHRGTEAQRHRDTERLFLRGAGSGPH
jgi:hypothetical protein